jgi:hypothetical protein
VFLFAKISPMMSIKISQNKSGHAIFNSLALCGCCAFTSLSFAQDFLPSSAEYAQVKDQGRSLITVDIDNDSLLLTRRDGFYTSGNHLFVKNVLNTKDRSVAYTWALGQDLYTASDIKLLPNQLSPKDHPYAGWLYVGLAREEVRGDGSSTKLGLDMGCLGPCAGGEWTQIHLHRLLQQPLPVAWSTQLKQEWGAVLSAAWSPARLQVNPDLDISGKWKSHFGNIFTDASLEMSTRYGRLNALPEQAASYVFLRGEARAVAYNASLQGGYFNHQTISITPQRLVPEVEFGYQYRNEKWGFLASVMRRGNEIKELREAQGAQNIGKIQISYAL